MPRRRLRHAAAPAEACRGAGSVDGMLRLVLPKGSLEQPTLELFGDADLHVTRLSSVDYRATIDDPRVNDVRILRPQEIPRYLTEGIFDLGISGRDWVEESGAEVVSLCRLGYSKATSRPVRIVVAVADDSPYGAVGDLPDGVRVSTEYPRLAARCFAEHGIEADVQLSYGATEAKVPEIVDCVVELTETGGALRAAGLRIIETVLVSHTELLANAEAYADADRRHAMGQIATLLTGVLEARGRVLVKLNVAAAALTAVIDLLPSMKAPTVNELYRGQGFAVETVVPKSVINTLIPALSDAGATDILEVPLAKIVH